MKLENGTILEVGKKYATPRFCTGEWVKILHIGKHQFFSVDESDAEGIWDIEKDWLPYEEEKKEKWYEILAYNSLGIGNHRFCDSKSLSNYEVEVDVLRQWDSKEEMIKDLKKG